MPPRKNKKKNQEDQKLDLAFEKSKWANLLEQNQQDDNLKQYQKKEIFNFDFSKQHLLLNQKDPPKKQEPKIVLTPQEQEQLNRRIERQKKEKQEKLMIKRKKMQQKKKIIQQNKQIENAKKQEQQKQLQQIQHLIKSNKNQDGKKIFYTIIIVFVILGLLNYQKQIYVKLSKFKLSSDINYYQILEASDGATDQELKSQYKKLVLRYHPDKNPNCHTCKDKFQKIMKAWQILGNAEKKLHYDQNSGFIKQIQSKSVTLTHNNFNHLVDDSDCIWIIQVYDSTNQYCHYFAQFWEQGINNYNNLVHFGRIDIWHQSNMKGYIPYNFQIFPGLYTVYNGIHRLCQLDYQRPMKSIDFCIQQEIKEIKINHIEKYEQIQSTNSKKIQVILGGNIKIGIRIKLINSKYSRYIDFYTIKNNQNIVTVHGKDQKFVYSSDNNKQIFNKYDKFLQGLIIQEKSMCEIYYLCKQSPCLLLIQQHVNFQGIFPFPVYKIKEYQKFKEKIEMIKNSTGLFQRFELGIYEDGKIELGNFDEIEQLNAQRGEVIELECIQFSILKQVMTHTETLITKLIQYYKILVNFE